MTRAREILGQFLDRQVDRRSTLWFGLEHVRKRRFWNRRDGPASPVADEMPRRRTQRVASPFLAAVVGCIGPHRFFCMAKRKNVYVLRTTDIQKKFSSDTSKCHDERYRDCSINVDTKFMGANNSSEKLYPNPSARIKKITTAGEGNHEDPARYSRFEN